MGNSESSGGGGGGNQLSTGQMIEKINNYSGRPGSKDPNDAGVTGMLRYLNERDGLSKDKPFERGDGLGRLSRYRDIEGLSTSIGMDDARRDKLLGDAYSQFNTQAGYLKNLGLDRPTPTPTATHSAVVDARPTHAHSTETFQRLRGAMDDPHGYLSLSGQKTEHLLKLGGGTLDTVLRADEAFRAATAGSWTLPDGQRQPLAANIAGNYNEDLCTKQLHMAGTSNSAPIQAFLGGKDAAINAASQGLDLYGDNQHALKALATAAMGVNLAMGPSQTLAGRGADTLSEQLSHNADGHARSK